MICDFCRLDYGNLSKVNVLDKEYQLCEYDVLKVNEFVHGSIHHITLNITWGGGRLDYGSWFWLRDFLRSKKIQNVLEVGGGLSSELFVIEGKNLVSFDVLAPHIKLLQELEPLKQKAIFHHYEYGQVPPVAEFYPGRKWNFVFVDGPQERSREVLTAMQLSTDYIYLHDPNMGEQSFFPGPEWLPMQGDGSKLFRRKWVADHHGQAIVLLKDHFGDSDITGIEIGTAYGCLTKAILAECQNVVNLSTIDPYLHDGNSEFEANNTQEWLDNCKLHASNALAAYKGRVNVLQMSSNLAFPLLKDKGKVDFVWIDGDHTYEQALTDMVFYKSLVRKGGIIGGHDYPTVRAAILKCFGEEPITGHDLTWWFYV